MKMFKRGLSVLLVLLLSFSLLGIPVFADTGNYTALNHAEVEVSDKGEVNVHISFGDIREAGVMSELLELQSAYITDGSMYHQLTDRQKTLYNLANSTSVSQILAAANHKGNPAIKSISHSIDGLTGKYFDGYIEDNMIYLEENHFDLLNNILFDGYAAIIAFCYDTPSEMWANSSYFSLNLVPTSSSQLRLVSIDLVTELSFDGKEEQMQNDMMRAADNIIAQVVDKKADRYTQLLSIYIYLIKNNTYYEGGDNPTIIHLPYSALIANDAYEPVCNGYASAMKILCDKLQIPCVMATSSDHAWVNVKMDDGYWYNIDPTFADDDSATVNTTFFLFGSRFQSGFGEYVEGDLHDPDIYGKMLRLRFPPKAAEYYEYVGGPKFPDVKSDDWFNTDVLFAAKEGLFKGNEKGYFKPENRITRAEFATVLANMLASDLSGISKSEFRDVPANSWYMKAVSWVKQNGLMNGDPDGRFRPNDPISRQEMCVVFSNLENGGSTNAISPFVDDAKIASWARDAVYFCRQDLAIIQGDNKGNFNPTNYTTRAEAATFFARYLRLEG